MKYVDAKVEDMHIFEFQHINFKPIFSLCKGYDNIKSIFCNCLIFPLYHTFKQ